jgi:hypothetical protein
MSKEVRCIMFSQAEVRVAVERWLLRQGPPLAYSTWEELDLSLQDGEVTARVRSADGSAKLDSRDLMGAVLLHCHRTRTPLSSRAVKKLELSNGNLVLVSSMNMCSAEGRVIGDAVVYGPTGEEREFASNENHIGRLDQ